MAKDADGFAGERRSDERTTTVYRPVVILVEGFAGFCLVRNLSPEGMMGMVYTSFAEGSPISIQFHSAFTVPGTVVWSSDAKVGIRFDDRIDVPAVLHLLSNPLYRGKVNRAPRLEIQTKGEIDLDGRTISVELQDISQRGLKVRSTFLRPEDEVTVHLQGMEPRGAIVRWALLETAGLNFIRPISYSELSEWVICQQRGAACPPYGPITVQAKGF